MNASRHAVEIKVRKTLNNAGIKQYMEGLPDGALVIVVRFSVADQSRDVIRAEAEKLSEQFKGAPVGVIEF